MEYKILNSQIIIIIIISNYNFLKAQNSTIKELKINCNTFLRKYLKFSRIHISLETYLIIAIK